jgi:type IV secretion system protein VirB1
MLDFIALAEACAPQVYPSTLQRLVSVESSFNPYAIGVVKGALKRQPQSLAEATTTAEWLERQGYNYSLGLAQVNKKNLKQYGLSRTTVFDPCENLRAGAAILIDCFRRSKSNATDEQRALRDALSCYYTGDHGLGYRLGYVAKIEARQPPQRPVTDLVPKGLQSQASDRNPIGEGRARPSMPPPPYDTPDPSKSKDVSSLLF